MAVVITYNRKNNVGKYTQRLIRVDYDTGDTAVTVDTMLKLIISYTVSPTSVTAKPWNFATVAGGVISITAADPLAVCYLYINAIGL